MSRKHYHFMGIGGISMSGLARHFLKEGHWVSGCDAAEGTTVNQLRAEGIEVHVGHDPAHLHGVDTLVSTMAAPNAGIPGSVEEIEAARELGIESIKRVDLLGRLFSERSAIGVTGSHGKSSITGMLATIFVQLADDPSVQIGANLPLIGGNMRHGKGPHIVAEVDESDPGFAHLETAIAVMPNLESDHVAGEYTERRNYHASLRDLESAVLKFAGQAGQLITCRDAEPLEKLVSGLPGRLTYGFHEQSDYRLTDLQLTASGSSFVIRAPSGESVRVTMNVPGVHNAENAGAALAAAAEAGLPLAEAAAVLEEYRGVGRRWQLWGEVKGAQIIDDYAVHPTEVTATLAVARNTGKRVRAILQPHRWVRTALHWQDLSAAASVADEVLVLDIYGAGEDPIPGVSSELIVNRIGELGTRAAYHTADSALEYLRATASKNDLMITLGAGDVWRIAAGLAEPAGPA